MGDLDAPPPSVSMPQNTVVVNGAAINLISQLVESVRADMRAMETRVNDKIDARFNAHEELHDGIRVEELDFQRRTRERLSDLERKDIAEHEADAVKAARREGQMSIITGIPRIAAGIERYGKWIATAIVGGAAALLAALGHVTITIGS